MLCQFERLLYPPDAKSVNAGSYMVAVYRPCESVIDGKGNTLSRIKAVGYGLPLSAQLRYDMKGRWNKDPKFGVQFEVETYDEVVDPTEEGIVAYLCSGQIKGIGPKLARRIYDQFGKDSLDIMDNDPEKLLIIPGISESRLEKICESYLANRAARDVVAFLAPYGITANRAVKLFQQYGNKTLETVKEHPYTLYEMAGVGFITADKIARSMGMSELSPERVDAALLYTLEDAECKGHLCLEKHAFIHACLKMLATPGLTEEMAANRAMRMVIEGRLATYGGFVYRTLMDLPQMFGTMDTIAPYDKIEDIYWAMKDAVESNFPQAKFIAHFSHWYEWGCMIYDRFIIDNPPSDPVEAMRLHNKIWTKGVRTAIAHGGVVNDHHGVGIKLGRLMKEQYGPAMQVFEGLKRSLDPNGILNPYKLGL